MLIVNRASRRTINVVYSALILAVIATLGSLYFSGVSGFVPCTLCWYQRIFMYPLVVILAVGIIRRDNDLAWYVLPLATFGFLTALYQNLFIWKVLPSATFCQAVTSCAEGYINWLGFITIPLLSLIAFWLIIVAMIIFSRHKFSGS